MSEGSNSKSQPTWLITGGSGFIGLNLVDYLILHGIKVVNVDIKPPATSERRSLWRSTDICDRGSIFAIIEELKPNVIVHLAAKADFDKDPNSFIGPNVEGTRNVLDAAVAWNIKRIIVTSTQYVNGPLKPFTDDLTYHPVNAYGQSKAEMERLVQSDKYADLDWVIIRPTNVWGPFHPRFPTQLWRYIRNGLYFHPAGDPIIRSYGYVSNVVRQILVLAQAPNELVRRRVFYVGEPPTDSGAYLDALSVALRGAPVRRVPRWFLKLLALIGDVVGLVGIPAPMTSDRFYRITTDHLARTEAIWSETEYNPLPLDKAIAETLTWLKTAYPKIYSC